MHVIFNQKQVFVTYIGIYQLDNKERYIIWPFKS